jgi:hypothetical protein
MSPSLLANTSGLPAIQALLTSTASSMARLPLEIGSQTAWARTPKSCSEWVAKRSARNGEGFSARLNCAVLCVAHGQQCHSCADGVNLTLLWHSSNMTLRWQLKQERTGQHKAAQDSTGSISTPRTA